MFSLKIEDLKRKRTALNAKIGELADKFNELILLEDSSNAPTLFDDMDQFLRDVEKELPEINL